MDCAEFLRWALPLLGFRWEGYKKVHRQVCKRITPLMREAGLKGFASYKTYLEDNPGEMKVLDSLCGITISRFYRDRRVFDTLRTRVLPSLAENAIEKGKCEVLCWSAGCASGEESYTLQIIWRKDVLPEIGRKIRLRITGTDTNEAMLERARQGMYPASSLRDLPEQLRDALILNENAYQIRNIYKEDIEFLEQDIRIQTPDGIYDLILCRNLVFTYFNDELQRKTFRRIMEKLKQGGVLVIGRRESLPDGVDGLRPLGDTITSLFRKE